MAIIIQPAPSGDVLSIYAPVIYEVTETTPFINPPIIKAQVFINGVAFGDEYVQPHYLSLGFIGGIATYQFRFDISELLRTYSNNNDTFDLGGNTNTMPAANAANAGFGKRCQFYVVFTSWQPLGLNGIYINSGIFYTSNTLFGLNIAVNQYTPEADIEYYGAVLPLKFLTNAPKRQALALGDKAYLSFWQIGNTRNAMRVQTFNAAGALMATVYYNIGQATNTVNRVRRLAVGAADVALLTSLVGVHYYTICIVENNTVPVPIINSEIREYYLTAECTKHSLHFLNALGADDVIRFKDFQYTNTIEKETYLANNSTYPVPQNRGLTVLNSRGVRSLTLIKYGVVNRLMPWLYELQNTSVAFNQPAGASQYTAVVVDKVSNAAAEGTEQSLQDIEIQCTLANIDYSHSN